MISFYCIDELDWRWDWTGKGHGIGLYNTEVLYSPKLVWWYCLHSDCSYPLSA